MSARRFARAVAMRASIASVAWCAKGQSSNPNGEGRLICDKAKCRNVWRVKIGFGRYAPSGAIQEMPDSIGVKQPIKPDLALFWKLLGNAVQTEFYGGGKWREVVSLDGVRCFVTRLWGKDPIAA